MSGSASATPSPGSSQTSSSESPTDLEEAGRKVYDKWTEEQETFLIENTNVIQKRMCLRCKCGSKIVAILSRSYYAAQHSRDNKQNCR